VREHLRAAMKRLAAESGSGSSTHPARALVMSEPPSIDANEITDKATSTSARCSSGAPPWSRSCTPIRRMPKSFSPFIEREQSMTRALSSLLALLAAGLAAAQEPIRVGVMNDQSSVYADFQGKGSVLAAQMAVEDYGGRTAGRRVEVVLADHQNKPTWARSSRASGSTRTASI